MEESKADQDSHKLARVSLHICSTCGRIIATTFKEEKEGDLSIEELELDFEIRSSRVIRLLSARHENGGCPVVDSDERKTTENTCW